MLSMSMSIYEFDHLLMVPRTNSTSLERSAAGCKTNCLKVISIDFVSCIIYPIQLIPKTDIYNILGKKKEVHCTSGRSGVPSGCGLHHQQSAVSQLSGERSSQTSRRSRNHLSGDSSSTSEWRVVSIAIAGGAKLLRKCQKRMVLVL